MKSLAKLALCLSIALASCVAGVGVHAEGPDDAPKGDADIERLIEQLGDDDYFKREQAQRLLERRGFEAFNALSAATEHEDLEIVARARHLLKLIQERLTREGDPPQVKSLLANYQLKNAAQRVSVMQSLSRLPENQGVPILCRLVRFEKSDVLAKQAAVALFSNRGPEKRPDEKLAALVRENIADSRRKPADWLRTWLLLSDKPEEAIAAWDKLVADERNDTYRRNSPYHRCQRDR